MSEAPLHGFLDECEREALHLVGAIQPWGVLLAGRTGEAHVRYISANAATWLGQAPHALLGLTLSEILPGLGADSHTRTPPSEPWIPPKGDKQLLPQLYEGPSGWLDGWLSCNANHWLLELQIALPDAERVTAYRPIPHRLYRMPGSESEWRLYCQYLAETLREVSGFERVMIYRFREDETGEVITESLDSGLAPYLGLRYPASDIPKIARELYLANSHRQIPDRAAEPVPILAVAGEDTPLDLSLSDLRAVSPVHLEYLKNMGVTASLSFSLVVGERLWGLIACHHRQPRHLPLPVRERCVAMSQAFSLAIAGFQGTRRLLELYESEEDITHLHEALRQAEDFSNENTPEASRRLGEMLLDLVAASGAALVDGDNLICFGNPPPAEAIRAQIAWMIAACDDSIFATDHLPDLFPPAQAYPEQASGLLAVRVRHYTEAGERLFLWWRPEQPQTVAWAGDPRKSALGDRSSDDPSDQTPAMLSPRASFEQWVETMTGCSDPWTNTDLLRARQFRSRLLRDINADLLAP